MSKYFGLLLLSATLSLSQMFAVGGDVTTQPVEEKIYVARPKCLLKKKAIIVRTKEGVFTAQSLHSDENGFYVKQDEIQKVTINPKKGCKPCWKKFKKSNKQPAENCKRCWKKCQKNNGKQLGQRKNWKANKEAANNGKQFGKRKHWKAKKETVKNDPVVQEPAPVDEVVEIVDDIVQTDGQQ